jgi:hypothetical protein
LCEAQDEDGATVRMAQVATRAALVGGNCTYSTEMMIRQVLDHGQAWTIRAAMRPAEPLPSKIAAPYVIGPDDTRVLANRLLDDAVEQLGEGHRALGLRGKSMLVQGQEFLVVTSIVAQPPS